MNKRTDTYGIKVSISETEIYDKLSEEEKKRFNKVIITDVTRDTLAGIVNIDCVVVNDCPVEEKEEV